MGEQRLKSQTNTIIITAVYRQGRWFEGALELRGENIAVYNVLVTEKWILENYTKYKFDRGIKIRDGMVVDSPALDSHKDLNKLSFGGDEPWLVLRSKEELMSNKRIAETRRKLDILGSKLRLLGSDFEFELAEDPHGKTVLFNTDAGSLTEFDMTKYGIDVADKNAFRYSGIKKMLFNAENIVTCGHSTLGMESLETVVITGGNIVLNIKSAGCDSFNEIQTEPGAIIEVGDLAFFNTNIDIKDLDISNVKKIGKYAFKSSKIAFNGKYDKLNIIEESAFMRSSGVGDLQLDSIVKIGNYAFVYSSIHSITIGEDCELIGNSAFDSCLNLESIFIKSNKIRRIKYNTFKRCKRLKELVIPEGVSVIEEWAFCDSALEKIVIPRSCMEILDGAFAGISNKAIIYLHKGFDIEIVKNSGFEGEIIEY